MNHLFATLQTLSNAEYYIAIVVYLSFIVTSLTGALGGMMLLATMALYFPVSILIPLHSVIHLSGDIARILPAMRSVAVKPALKFCMASLIGVGLGYWFYLNLDATIILVALSIYILLITWLTNRLVSKLASIGYEWLGLIMGYISVTVGAPGPIHLAKIQTDYNNTVVIVTTAAIFTAFINVIKISIFMIGGFAFVEYQPLLLIGCSCAILGSLTGVMLRSSLGGILHNKLIIKIPITLASILIVVKAIVI